MPSGANFKPGQLKMGKWDTLISFFFQSTLTRSFDERRAHDEHG